MFRAVTGGRGTGVPPAAMRQAGRRAVRAGLAAALLVPGVAGAQASDCRLVGVGGYTHSQRFFSNFGPSEYRHHASGGVDYRCSDGTRVQADSAVVFESDNQVQLYGNVRFEDPDTELRADSAIYFSSRRQLRATSGVEVTDRASGTMIRGDVLIYDQASEFRALDRMFVYGGEPHATFLVASAPPPEEPAAGDSAAAAAAPDSAEAGAAPDSVAADPAPDSVETDPAPDSVEAAAAPDSAEAGAASDSAEAGPAPGSAPESLESADTVPPTPYDIRAERFRFEEGAISARAARSRSRGTQCRPSATRWTMIRKRARWWCSGTRDLRARARR